MEIGRTTWVIAEGYIPPDTSHRDPRLISHEAACILNVTDRDADIAITIYFKDRAPVGPYRVSVAAGRTRFDDLKDPEPIPHDTDYAGVIESGVPLIVRPPVLIRARRRGHC